MSSLNRVRIWDRGRHTVTPIPQNSNLKSSYSIFFRCRSNAEEGWFCSQMNKPFAVLPAATCIQFRFNSHFKWVVWSGSNISTLEIRHERNRRLCLRVELTSAVKGFYFCFYQSEIYRSIPRPGERSRQNALFVRPFACYFSGFSSGIFCRLFVMFFTTNAPYLFNSFDLASHS